jgi:Arc/MetJ-type ribon-helix-helix transcriptional regulator
MKEKKTQQLRVRLTDSLVNELNQHINRTGEFNSISDFVRQSVIEKIGRDQRPCSNKGSKRNKLISLYRNQEFSDENYSHRTSRDIDVYVNNEDKKRIYRIYDLFSPLNSTNSTLHELTERIFQDFTIDFEGYESKLISLNHFELFELTHKIVYSTIFEIQRVKYNSVDELFEFNLNTLTLFLEPYDITVDELEWVNEFISRNVTSNKDEVEIKLPENAERNYYINVRRILKENNTNPDFNNTLLDFFDRTRDS